MQRYARPQAAYPGEWAFVLGAKLVNAVPAFERQEKRQIRAVDFQELAVEFESELNGIGPTATFTGTDHLHLTITAVATSQTPKPTKGDEDNNGESSVSNDGISNGDEQSSVDDSTIDETEAKISGSLNARPTSIPTGVFSDTISPTTPPTSTDPANQSPGLDAKVVGQSGGGGGMNKAAIAGAVVGTLAAVGLILFLLFFFRKKIRRRFYPVRYNRMGPTPDPAVSRYVDACPAMNERMPTTLFGSNASQGQRHSIDSGLPAPAAVRHSITTSRRESRQARYVRQSLLRGRGGSFRIDEEEAITLYSSASPIAGAVAGTRPRSQSPQYRSSVQRRMSNRFPIAVPNTAASAPSSTNGSPTNTEDGFYHSLSPPKHRHEASKLQPVVVPIPAFLIPTTPAEPKDSRFSWSTHNPTVPPTPRSLPRTSIAESEPRFRGVNSWVSNQTKRMERQERLRARAEAENALVKGRRRGYRVCRKMRRACLRH
ncbi:hypothetical protein BDZ91DRAFT_18690 [Kalaharituber pfeilii]|nr:hypothetical protein BDZ91DRAFT_18690 [Kalaharituber pfeilii]